MKIFSVSSNSALWNLPFYNYVNFEIWPLTWTAPMSYSNLHLHSNQFFIHSWHVICNSHGPQKVSEHCTISLYLAFYIATSDLLHARWTNYIYTYWVNNILTTWCRVYYPSSEANAMPDVGQLCSIMTLWSMAVCQCSDKLYCLCHP